MFSEKDIGLWIPWLCGELQNEIKTKWPGVLDLINFYSPKWEPKISTQMV